MNSSNSQVKVTAFLLQLHQRDTYHYYIMESGAVPASLVCPLSLVRQFPAQPASSVDYLWATGCVMKSLSVLTNKTRVLGN
jgi:hypothetical protein